MPWNSSILRWFTIFHFCVATSVCDEILGCGGFVKSRVAIDFSKVEVKLLTPDGILKYQTECAPNNGYYMVPFVDKGDFVLKVQPPQGWSFDPMSVDLHVDGVNDPCSQGKDINFEFQGFTVTGQVKSAGQEKTGPKGVKLTLHSADTSKVLTTTVSSDSGSFQFPSVFPGKYKIQASHASFTFKQSEIPVTVVETNVQCSSAIIVSGYDVHGKVSAAQLPVKDVHMLLFSENQVKEKVKGCSDAPPSGSEDLVKSRKLVFVCSTTSDAQGAFVFPSLPPQDYVLVPFHKAEHIEFDVEPQELKFSVKSGSVYFDKNFSVTGFSVTGFVLDGSKGKPVPGVKVFVNGKQQAVTTDKGMYRLQHMTSGMYKISLEKEDIFFPVSSVRVGSDTPRLPDIVADQFSLCGSVDIKVRPTKPFKTEQISISISRIDGTNEKVQKLNSDGTFCFKLAPGDYALAPVIPKTLANSGIQLSPAVQKVTLNNSPLKGIEFSQVLADIRVDVTCIVSCKGVKIEVTMEGETHKVVEQTVQDKMPMLFRNLLPGTYLVKAIHDHWCWKQNETTVNVKAGSEDNVAKFVQFGFKLTCSVSHDLTVAIRHHDNMVDNFQLKKGRNQLCLAEPGQYELKPMSCHLFEVQKVLYNTANPKPVVMQAFAHQTNLRIVSTHADANMRVMIKSTTKDEEFQMVPKQEEGKDGKVVYVVQYQAKDKEMLTITPSSDILLFDPPSATVKVAAALCEQDLYQFNAFKGLFIDGSISPKIEGVSVTVTAESGDQTDVFLETDKNGKYRVGPLNPQIKYAISATKEGYVFVQDSEKKENFMAKKLSKISFSVTMENEESLPLAGVLITISGGSYRSNSLTDSDGNLVLTKLEPAQYYFKAVMKEYEFRPSSQVIDLKEGDELKIKILGKRVAFSCFGSITSLNGQAESGVTVQAFSISEGTQHAEEATTDEQGQFRIKGLLPDTSYRIEVKKLDVFDRVTPFETKITVAKDDVMDVRFIAFRSLSQFELTGNVVTDNEFLRYLKVALYHSSDLSEPVHTASLSVSPFFHFPPLDRDNQEYHIRLETTVDKSKYTFTEPAAGFFASGTYKHITFQFHPQMKVLDPDTPQASYITLPIALLIILLVYNHTKVLAWIQVMTEKAFAAYANHRNEPVEVPPVKSSGRKSRKEK